MTRPVQIGIDDYRDRVYACWLGKNIGGTLGAPYECQKKVQTLTYYDPMPDESAPNDDLDLQLAWLKCLEDRGVDIFCGDLADYWVECLSSYPWNEYGFCRRNLCGPLSADASRTTTSTRWARPSAARSGPAWPPATPSSPPRSPGTTPCSTTPAARASGARCSGRPSNPPLSCSTTRRPSSASAWR